MRLYAAKILQDNEHRRVKLLLKAPKIGFIVGLLIGILVPWLISGRLTVMICIVAVPVAFLGFVVGSFCPYLFYKLINPPFKLQRELEKDISGCEVSYSQFGSPPQEA